jgi:hypothetical protein
LETIVYTERFSLDNGQFGLNAHAERDLLLQEKLQVCTLLLCVREEEQQSFWV